MHADIGSNALIGFERGIIVTNADTDSIVMPEYFGPQSFHNGGYSFFCYNIQENVAKHIAAWNEQ